MELQETYAITGPQLEVLGEAESKLPAPARKKPVAAMALVVMALIAVFGLGGLKLNAKYNAAQKLFYGENNEYGVSIATMLEDGADYAANMATVGAGVLGKDAAEVQQVNAAVEQLKNAESVSEKGEAERNLISAVQLLYDAVYPTLEKTDATRASSFRAQYQQALSDYEIMNHMTYNDSAAAYNRTAEGFPASLISGLWGIREVEQFQ